MVKLGRRPIHNINPHRERFIDHASPEDWARGQNAVRFFLGMRYRDFYGELVEVYTQEGQTTDYEPFDYR